MSKGLGRVQRRILDSFDKWDGFCSLNSLVAECYEISSDIRGLSEAEQDAWLLDLEAKIASIKRALASLKAEGKVFSFHRDSDGFRMWAGERFGLYITIKDMQQMSPMIARSGDRAMEAHTKRMLPLLYRAKELGIDLYKPWQEQMRPAA